MKSWIELASFDIYLPHHGFLMCSWLLAIFFARLCSSMDSLYESHCIHLCYAFFMYKKTDDLFLTTFRSLRDTNIRFGIGEDKTK